MVIQVQVPLMVKPKTLINHTYLSTFSDLHAARDHMVCLFINQRVLIIH